MMGKRPSPIRNTVNDFSQLPIVDEWFRPEGMITAESILPALKNVGAGPDNLYVLPAALWFTA
jgi:hypothetical protein